MGDVAENALLLALGVDAETARGEPEVSVVVEDHGKKVLRQLLAERSLCCRLDIDVEHLFKFGDHAAVFLRRAEHQHVVVTGRTDDAVFRVQERVGALNHVAAAVMLLRGKITERFRLFGAEVADGDAAEQRDNRMTIAVKVNRGRCIRIRRFIGNIDLRIDADRQNFIRRVGVVAVVVDIRVAFCHVWVLLHLLGLQSLYGQRCRWRCRRFRSCTFICGCLCPSASGH